MINIPILSLSSEILKNKINSSLQSTYLITTCNNKASVVFYEPDVS